MDRGDEDEGSAFDARAQGGRWVLLRCPKKQDDHAE